jgi:hypothetical protein
VTIERAPQEQDAFLLNTVLSLLGFGFMIDLVRLPQEGETLYHQRDFGRQQSLCKKGYSDDGIGQRSTEVRSNPSS